MGDGNGTGKPGERRAWGRRYAYALLRGLAVLALVPLGSTGAFAMPITTLVLSVWCATVFMLPGKNNWLSVTAILVAAAIAAYAFLQVVPGAPFMPPAAAWSAASGFLGEALPATTSIAPGISLSALPAVVTPLLVFASALRLLDTDEGAVRMLRFLAFAGVVVALFGIVQFALFPDIVLVFPKRHYLDSLTAVFVNRNNAATFLGCTLVVLAGLTVAALKDRPLKAIFGIALKGRKSRRDWRLLLLLASLGFTSLALFLTNSRAGITSTLISLCCLSVLMSALARSRERLSWPARLRRVATAFVLTAVACVGGFALLGGQTLRRMEVRGTEDARFCFLPDIWRALVDAWPHGTGAGTFELAFLPYRSAECGIYGSLDRAHNFFLEGAVTLGAPFVAAIAVSYGVLVPVLLRGVLRRRRYAFVPATGLSVLLLLTLHDLLDFPIQIPGIAIWAAIILAIACGTAMRRGFAQRSPEGDRMPSAGHIS